MRLVFNRCHGENPMSLGDVDWTEPCGFVGLEFLINSLRMPPELDAPRS